MIMMVVMSRAIKNDQFWREVSDVRKRSRGSPGGGMRALINIVCATKHCDEDNPQNRADVNAMVTIKDVGVG